MLISTESCLCFVESGQRELTAMDAQVAPAEGRVWPARPLEVPRALDPARSVARVALRVILNFSLWKL